MTDINTVTTPSGCLLLIDSRVTDHTAATGSVEFTLASVLLGEVVSATSVATEKEYGFSADVPMAYP